jgi:hypothetical protein
MGAPQLAGATDHMKLSAKLVLFAFLLAIGCTCVHAQSLSSGAQTIALQATLSESISINLSDNAVSFNLVPGQASNPGNKTVVATTTWISKPGRNVTTYIYFTAASTALTDGSGNNIPSSAFEVSDNGAALRPLTQTVVFGGAGAGLKLTSTKVTGLTKTGSHIDSMNFNINLSALPQLPAGTYVGTVTLRAEAN